MYFIRIDDSVYGILDVVYTPGSNSSSGPALITIDNSGIEGNIDLYPLLDRELTREKPREIEFMSPSQSIGFMMWYAPYIPDQDLRGHALLSEKVLPETPEEAAALSIDIDVRLVIEEVRSKPEWNALVKFPEEE